MILSFTAYIHFTVSLHKRYQVAMKQEVKWQQVFTNLQNSLAPYWWFKLCCNCWQHDIRYPTMFLSIQALIHPIYEKKIRCVQIFSRASIFLWRFCFFSLSQKYSFGLKIRLQRVYLESNERDFIIFQVVNTYWKSAVQYWFINSYSHSQMLIRSDGDHHFVKFCSVCEITNRWEQGSSFIVSQLFKNALWHLKSVFRIDSCLL